MNVSPFVRAVLLEEYEVLADAASRLGVSDSLIRRWCREGKLPCLKLGRDWLVERGAEPEVKGRPQRS